SPAGAGRSRFDRGLRQRRPRGDVRHRNTGRESTGTGSDRQGRRRESEGSERAPHEVGVGEVAETTACGFAIPIYYPIAKPQAAITSSSISADTTAARNRRAL